MAPHVLLVDDSATVRMVIAAELREAGFRVTPVPTVDGARRALMQHRDRNPFSLAILDVQLPDGDGIDLLQEMRRDPSFQHLPIMILSSDARFGSRVRGLGVGADDFVGKPHSKSYLVSRARALTSMMPSDGQDAQMTDHARRVLVVDADNLLRDKLGRLLRIGHGCDVVSLENVDQAAQYLEVEGSGVDGSIVDRRYFLRLLGLLRSRRPGTLPLIVLDDSPTAAWPPSAAKLRSSPLASALVMPRATDPNVIAEAMHKRLAEMGGAPVSSSATIPKRTIDAVRRMARLA